MNNKTYENYLAHHGVLGMRWGVRRYQSYSNGSYRSAKRKAINQTYKKSKRNAKESYKSSRSRSTSRAERKAAKNTYRKHMREAARTKRESEYEAFTSKNQKVKDRRKALLNNRRTASDEELRREINRLQLEKQYSELASADLKSGQSYARSILNNKNVKDAVAKASVKAVKKGAKYASKVGKAAM